MMILALALMSFPASGPVDAVLGRLVFDLPFPGGNGRSCATCHVHADHLALTPARIATLPPTDPLFRRIDADDPTAPVPQYDHLRAGLVRVVLPLAPNLDVIDAAGNVITNASRTIEVWRGVPTIENTAMTAPYQYDGRQPAFQPQALAALRDHSEVTQYVPTFVLDLLAQFQASIFSSPLIRNTSRALDRGDEPGDPVLALQFPPGSDEAAGKALYIQTCALCHGGARGNAVTSQLAHDQTFFALNPDGTPVFGPQGPVLLGTNQDDPFMNIGSSVFSYLTQPGTGPIPTLPPPFDQFSYIDMIPNHSTLPLPQYRIRFYTDATRTTKRVDLPPSPTLGLSPSFVPQAYSVDPGACIITGDPADYEGFEAPQLRGISKTAPYFHDNSLKTLEDVVEFYSSRVFIFVTAAGLPPIHPSLSAGGLPEALSPTQKRQLVKFLKKI